MGWWGRSSVRVAYALLVVVSAVALKALTDGDVAGWWLAVVMGVPAVVLTAVGWWRHRSGSRPGFPM